MENQPLINVDQGTFTSLPVPLRSDLLSSQVFKIIADAIFQGKIQPGQVLRELPLSKTLGVSQATVREALNQLGQVGLVVRIPNQGTMVTQLNGKELRDRLRIRLVLEELAAANAARSITEEDVTRLKELARSIASAVAANSDLELTQADQEFHRYIWRISRSPILFRTLDLVTTPIFAFVSILYRMASPTLHIESHEDIVAALRTGNPDVARTAIRSHIERPYGTILSARERDLEGSLPDLLRP